MISRLRGRVHVTVLSSFSLLGLLGACGASADAVDPTTARAVVGPVLHQMERPTTCPLATQPAVLTLSRVTGVPVWGCLPACPVAEEFVTDVQMADDELRTFTPSCTHVCADGSHRTSYADSTHHGHCSAGGVDDQGQREAQLRERRFQEIARSEEERRTTLVLRARQEDEDRTNEERRSVARESLRQLEHQLYEMETTNAPWTFSLLQTHHDFERRLHDLSNQILIPSEARTSLIDRVAATDAKAEVSEHALGVQRSSRSAATTHAMRLQSCEAPCEESGSRCLSTCPSLPFGACDSCRQELVSCRVSCASSTP